MNIEVPNKYTIYFAGALFDHKDLIGNAVLVSYINELSNGKYQCILPQDLEQATNIARTMVTRYGMSEKLGPRTFGKREELVFLGREISEQRDYSDSVAETIDNEVHRLIEAAYQTAKRLLSEHKAKLSQVSRYLLDHESVENDELETLFDSPTPDLPEAVPAG